MKRIIVGVLVLGVCLTPLTVPLIVQPSWAQSQNPQVQELQRLIQQAIQQQQQGQPRQAIETWQQVLAIARQFKVRETKALALNGIGFNYNSIGQPQEALKYYNEALLITREVGDCSGEATTLTNIGLVYRDTNQVTQAIENWEKSINITLEMRSGLQRENRQKFLQAKGGTAKGLISLLINQNQPDRAFQWVNIATTADLADYTRLIDAKVANPQAQKALDEWNQKNQQLQFLRRQLEDKFSENLS